MKADGMRCVCQPVCETEVAQMFVAALAKLLALEASDVPAGSMLSSWPWPAT